MKPSPAQTVMQRIDALGEISDEPGKLTRTFGSPAMRCANELVGRWMVEAGMSVQQDAIGNLIGHYANSPKSKQLAGKMFLLGSHLDTVRDAGKFDGPLGVLAAIACVQRLNETKVELPFSIKVIGFADEEGVRFQSTYLGSKAIAGTLKRQDLALRDRDGISMADAIRAFGGNPEQFESVRMDPHSVMGYAEVHIEQGPVLEQRGLSVGVVTAIAGQSRFRVSFIGEAGHAGTTPMNMRRDALCAAAEFITGVELQGRAGNGLVATVGEMTVLPGASNVIPGEVRLSLDVRHAQDDVRKAACADLQTLAQKIASQRQAHLSFELVHEVPVVQCDAKLSAVMTESVRRHQPQVASLASGAGHDAAAIAAIAPITMLFVRCKGGVSHHPAESVDLKDIEVAIAVLEDFLKRLASGEG